MEVSETTVKVISNIHSAILKVTSKLEWAVGQVNDNTRRLNGLTDLTTVSSEANRVAIKQIKAEGFERSRALKDLSGWCDYLEIQVNGLKAEVASLKGKE